MGKRLLLCIQSALLIWGLWCVPAPAAAAEPQAADEFGLLRSKWSVYLIGSGYDPNDPNIAKAVASIDAKVTNASGTGFWDTMQKETGRTYLWSDLKGSADAVDAASAYNRLRDMTIAWATAGSSHYRNEALKNDIIGGLDWLYAKSYITNRNAKPANWWEWEIGIPQSLGDMMVLLHDQLSLPRSPTTRKRSTGFAPILPNGRIPLRWPKRAPIGWIKRSPSCSGASIRKTGIKSKKAGTPSAKCFRTSPKATDFTKTARLCFITISPIPEVTAAC